MMEFFHRLEGVEVMSLPELDPSSERVKVVTTAGIVGFPAKKFIKDHARLIERGRYCVAKFEESGTEWLVLWIANGSSLARLRLE